MAKPLVTNELWEKIEPLLPPVREAGTRGRPPVPNRAALTGILFVLKTGIAWEDLPREMNCGCGMTCWRRLRYWTSRASGSNCTKSLVAKVTKANEDDRKQLIPMVDAVPPVAGKVGAPKRRPDYVPADRGYDSDPHRARLEARGIEPVITRRNTDHGSGLGKFRCVVERTISWLHQFRRPRSHWEKSPQMHQAFLTLGCAIICLRLLHEGFVRGS